MANVTVTVNNNPVPTISQNGQVLTVNGTFSSYQWYLDGAIINGANSQSYTPSQNGVYSVQVTNGSNCKGNSSITISNLSIDQLDISQLVNVYPNPASSEVFVQIYLPGNDVSRISVLSMQGTLLKEINVSGSVSSRIDLDYLAAGVYMIRINKGNNTVTKKLIKK